MLIQLLHSLIVICHLPAIIRLDFEYLSGTNLQAHIRNAFRTVILTNCSSLPASIRLNFECLSGTNIQAFISNDCQTAILTNSSSLPAKKFDNLRLSNCHPRQLSFRFTPFDPSLYCHGLMGWKEMGGDNNTKTIELSQQGVLTISWFWGATTLSIMTFAITTLSV